MAIFNAIFVSENVDEPIHFDRSMIPFSSLEYGIVEWWRTTMCTTILRRVWFMNCEPRSVIGLTLTLNSTGVPTDMSVATKHPSPLSPFRLLSGKVPHT